MVCIVRSVHPNTPSLGAFSKVAITSLSVNCCSSVSLCLTLTGSNFGGFSLSFSFVTVQTNMGCISNAFQKSVPKINCVVIDGIINVLTFMVFSLTVYGISMTACVSCVVPSAVRLVRLYDC